MSGVNPQGCKVEAFKEPSGEELEHDFLWRCSKVLPERGRIGIFNRSYYEEVLVVRVHPELLSRGEPTSSVEPAANVWKDRYEDINAFERHLHRNGTRIVKIFLHASREEQKNRFLERLDDPAKNWRFLCHRPGRAPALVRVPGCLRGGVERNLDSVGALVCGAGRSQVRAASAGRRHRGQCDRRDGSATTAGRFGRSDRLGSSQG
jgi:hypothetical protein